MKKHRSTSTGILIALMALLINFNILSLTCSAEQDFEKPMKSQTEKVFYNPLRSGRLERISASEKNPVLPENNAGFFKGQFFLVTGITAAIATILFQGLIFLIFNIYSEYRIRHLSNPENDMEIDHFFETLKVGLSCPEDLEDRIIQKAHEKVETPHSRFFNAFDAIILIICISAAFLVLTSITVNSPSQDMIEGMNSVMMPEFKLNFEKNMVLSLIIHLSLLLSAPLIIVFWLIEYSRIQVNS